MSDFERGRSPDEIALIEAMIRGIIPVVPESEFEKSEKLSEEAGYLVALDQSGMIINRDSRKVVDPESQTYVAVFRGVNWIGSGVSQGTFLSRISDEEYQGAVEAFKRGEIEELPDREVITAADHFPDDWNGDLVVQEIRVSARRLTKNGEPIELKLGHSHEIPQAE